MKPGDIYIEAPRFELHMESGNREEAALLAAALRGRQVQCAIDAGACAIIIDQAFEPDDDEDEEEEEIDVPMIIVKDTIAEQQRLAIAFYDHPSTRMKTVGITGQLTIPSAVCVLHSSFLGGKWSICECHSVV